MKELIKEIEANEEFREWVDSKYHLARFTWLEMPNTAKLAIIQEWIREEKGIHIDVCPWLTIRGRYGVELFKVGANHKGEIILVSNDCYPEYNQALTEGIKEAIKLIG